MVYLIAELALFVLVARWIGVGNTILAILAGSVLGGVLLRTIGVKAVRDYREAVAAGRPPGPSAVSGTIGVTGAALLFVPGFISDLVGLLCVFPPTRFLLRPLVVRFLEQRVDSPSFARWFGPRKVRPQWGDARSEETTDTDEVIEGEVVDEPPPSARRDDEPGHRDDDGPRPLS